MKRRASEPANYTYASETSESRAEEAKWPRPALPADFSAATHPLTFQQMDISYVMEGDWPVIKVYGCSQEGHSVALSVHNFSPYMYAALPPPLDDPAQQADEAELCQALRDALELRLREGHKQRSAVEVVQAVEVVHRTPIMHYQEQQRRFFKITLCSPKFVTKVRSVLECDAQPMCVDGLGQCVFSPTYESNVAYVLRFMIDKGIGGASWLHLPAGRYEQVVERETSATLELACAWDDLVAIAVDDEKWAHSAPLRILSFDIECAGRTGIFPEPQVDPVIQIANYVTVVGREKPLLDSIFVLDTCPPIAGCDVRCFRTEEALLEAWSFFVTALDPDLLTGYNIVNFDLGYLKDRADALGLADFGRLTRVLDREMRVKDTKFSSAQTGTRESKEWFIDGRLVFDVYQVIQSDHKLSSYTLNNVSAHFLEEQKEDVHHSQITKLHRGSPEDRHRLAVYCRKDALLPQRLIEKLMKFVSYVEMARVTGVPFGFLLTRGQSIKVMSQILRRARTTGYLVPTFKDRVVTGEGFQGAKVFEPKVGFYRLPVPTLDFSSLYPSIMQAHNLCYTTLLHGPTPLHLVEGIDYAVSPMGHRFVLAKRKQGLLPLILTELLAARGRAKKLMAIAAGTPQEKVYNARQLALKVSANSVYGFTGQEVGQLPCLEISSSVTGYGRDMIQLTAKIVEETYSIKNGFAHDAQVLYGDTDSVMVLLGVETVAEAIEIGKKAAVLVSKHFLPPIKLEFEKVYFPWLLMSKKKYAGLFWTNPDKWDKLDAKGIESVRRDNCGIVRYAVDNVLHRILEKQDIEGSLAFSRQLISEILQNRIDLSLLIVTKAYSRPAEAYKTKTAHIELALRMKKRDPATAPAVGDRIPYVIVRGEKKAKMADKAEDPLYVLANDIPIDAQYYIDQLVSPLCRLLAPVLPNPEALLTTGEHMRHMVIPRSTVPTSGGGGLFKFVAVRENCLGCKAPLAAHEKVLCQYCHEQAVEIYARHLDVVREKEMEFSRLWAHCQQCQGNVHLEVVCAANDCPIFYKRTKAQKDRTDAQRQLARFDALDW